MLGKLVNALLFQSGWFICVLGGNSYWLLGVLAILLGHLAWYGTWKNEGRLMVLAFVLGALVDGQLRVMGVLTFAEPGFLAPLWMGLLWPLLAMTLGHCLAWTARPLWLAAGLGAVSGPLSYYAGAQLAGVGMPLGLITTVAILAAIWAVVFPLLHRLVRI
jgi:hypothetical protein